MRRLVDLVGLGRSEEQRKPSVPNNTAVFAVGDIHGRVDLLIRMHKEILEKASELPENTRKIVVYIGDYIDHGPHSADVIDTLISGALPGFESFYLLGNHELAFLSYLKGEADFLRWTHHRPKNEKLPKRYLISTQLKRWLYEEGGLQTLASYGVQTSQSPDHEALATMRISLLRKIPTDHLGFLESLALSYSIGVFFFAHAGVDPTRALNEQNPSDLLGIQSRFLDYERPLDKIIIHGHTPYQAPCLKLNRIGIDTNAYQSGLLTGIMICPKSLRVLQTN